MSGFATRCLPKLMHPLLGEVTTDLKRRLEGRRVKHRMKRNSIKMYDKDSVLRVETSMCFSTIAAPCLIKYAWYN